MHSQNFVLVELPARIWIDLCSVMHDCGVVDAVVCMILFSCWYCTLCIAALVRYTHTDENLTCVQCCVHITVAPAQHGVSDANEKETNQEPRRPRGVHPSRSTTRLGTHIVPPSVELSDFPPSKGHCPASPACARAQSWRGRISCV